MSDDGVESLPDPPAAPEIQRRVSLHPNQWVLLPLMVALPLLALAGLFGEQRDVARAQAGSVEVTVHYVRGLRYKVLATIDVHVHNRGAAPLDTVTVAVDTTYVKGFSNVAAVPPFDESFEIPLLRVAAGEVRFVRIEVRAERYWRQRGGLTVTAGADTARVPLSTFIFP